MSRERSFKICESPWEPKDLKRFEIFVDPADVFLSVYRLLVGFRRISTCSRQLFCHWHCFSVKMQAFFLAGLTFSPKESVNEHENAFAFAVRLRLTRTTHLLRDKRQSSCPPSNALGCSSPLSLPPLLLSLRRFVHSFIDWVVTLIYLYS